MCCYSGFGQGGPSELLPPPFFAVFTSCILQKMSISHLLWFQNLQNECAHTQTTAQKLSSFLKSWTTLPSSEVREYNKSIKSTMGQLSGTQKSLQDKTSALEGLSQLFDQYNNVNADMKRYLILFSNTFLILFSWYQTTFFHPSLCMREDECWFADFV